MIHTATVHVLKRKRKGDELDGYVFQDAKHARRWMAQPLIAKAQAGEYEVVRVLATRSARRCPCCKARHWWMRWRGEMVPADGAKVTPYARDGED